MPKRLLQALAVLVVSSSPLAAQTLNIEHSAVGCVMAGKFPRLEARFVPGDAVGRARVFFQTTDAKRWYSVAMKPDSGGFSGVLPKPKKSLDAFRYYIEVTDNSLSTSRTAEYTTSVVAGPAGCKGKMMGGGLASAAVTLEVPAGAPAVPAGFSGSGLTAAGVAGAATVATGAAVVAGGAAGGGISTGVIVAVAGVAAAGAGVAVAVGASKGGEDSPAGPSSPVAGKWSGAGADGMIVDVTGGFCPRAWDLELNFTSSSAGDIGTATTRLRETPCADVLNQSNAYTLHRGSVTANSIAFEFGSGSMFIATFTGSRMTGTFTTTAEFPQSGHFVVNRQ